MTKRQPPEEWVELPRPYTRYLVSTRGRVFDVHMNRFADPRERGRGAGQHGGDPNRPGYNLARDDRRGAPTDGGRHTFVPIGVLLLTGFCGAVGMGFAVRKINEAEAWTLDNVTRWHNASKKHMPMTVVH